ncbi:MAG TPA: hypothetical protein VFQ51_13665 [Vicinamibacteria bacterium]|nr:hypothetical protein [Vicinamibacteria bacterium]
MPTSLHKAALGPLIAAAAWATAGAASSAEDTVEQVRFMVVLKQGITPGQVPSVTSRLERHHGVRTVATFTQGAQVGILVEASPARAPQLQSDGDIFELPRVGDLKSASQEIPADKLYKLPTGWAIPGSYEVHLNGASLGFEADRNQRLPAWKDPNWKERDTSLIKAVEDVAQSLIARRGGKMTFTGAPADASFTCAMTEAQARSMISDPRVRFVAESAYMIQAW